jgi:hypothetical protein
VASLLYFAILGVVPLLVAQSILRGSGAGQALPAGPGFLVVMLLAALPLCGLYVLAMPLVQRRR